VHDSLEGRGGTGNVVEAVRHLRTINAQMRRLHSADANELYALAKDLQALWHWFKK